MKNDLDFHVLSALIFLTLSFRTNNFYCVLSYCFKITTKRLILAFQSKIECKQTFANFLTLEIFIFVKLIQL